MEIKISRTKCIKIDQSKSEIQQLFQIKQQYSGNLTSLIAKSKELAYLKKFFETQKCNQKFFKSESFILKVMNVLSDNDRKILFQKSQTERFDRAKRLEKAEMIEDFSERLKFLSQSFVRQVPQLLRQRFKNDLKTLLEKTSWMNKKNFENRNDVTFVAKKDVNIRTRIYYLLNKITEFPKCLQCGKVIYTNIMSEKKPFQPYCSLSCANSSSIRTEHYKATCQERFGASSFLGSTYGQQAIRNYYLENFGVEWVSQVDGWVDKMKENNGGIWPIASEQSRAKAAATRQQHIDDDPEFITKAVKKGELTSLKRYGARYKTQTPEGRKLSSEIASRPEVIAKRAYTTKLNFYNNVLLKDKDFEALFSFEEYLKYLKDGTPLLWRCKKCGNIFVGSLKRFQPKGSKKKYLLRCHKCYPPLTTASNEERQLAKWLSDICPKDINVLNCVDENFRVITPYQLDILIQDKKSGKYLFAIEYNGARWHSLEENNGDMNKQLRKTQLCEQIGLPLIHIYDDEWKDPKMSQSLKRILKRSLEDKIVTFGSSEKKITVRRDIFSKCTVPYEFEVVEEITPQVILRPINSSGNQFSVPNCGYLICKRVNRRCNANNQREN